MVEPTHIPVLVHEVLQNLFPEGRNTTRIIDGTIGQGGHAEYILRDHPTVHLLGVDRDPVNLSIAKSRLEGFSDRTSFVCSSYGTVKEYAESIGFTPVDGILLDLGYSSMHVDDATRGFSFQSDGPLDMRYNQQTGETAADIVNSSSIEDLANIFRVYGEEPASIRIAKEIYQVRKKYRIESTSQLADLVLSIIPRYGKTHPATRVFQALRIAVNDELGELQRALPELSALLAPGGRICIISFHSLEDRIVKRFFQQEENKTLRTLNKHVIIPSEEESRKNPRSRSAKLRVAERL